MMLWWKIITIFLISYDCIYILSHLPWDLIMLCRKRKIHYPSPPFKRIRNAFFYITASYLFLFYIYFIPIIAINQKKNVYSNYQINSMFSNIIRIVGIILMSIGLIIAILGRIGRGFYLNQKEPILATTWGHRIIRHPEYFMYITGFIGLPLVTLNFWLLILLTGIIPYYRIAKYEEMGLISLFGKKYILYKQYVGMFLPKFKDLRKDLKFIKS
ncbi:MAG: hypothetical protein K9W44_12040 [Candidatus Lokiarchaeota archaeon]|nr:hypothetical protein [Candidatus Harpocratesius repetitus]